MKYYNSNWRDFFRYNNGLLKPNLSSEQDFSIFVERFIERYELHEIHNIFGVIKAICNSNNAFDEFRYWENVLNRADVWPCIAAPEKIDEISIDCNYKALCAYLSYTNQYGKNAMFANAALHKISECKDRLYEHIIGHPYACSKEIAEKLIGTESNYEFNPFDNSLPIFSLTDILEKIEIKTKDRSIKHRFTSIEFVGCSSKENPFRHFDWSQARQLIRSNDKNYTDVFFIGMPNSGKTSLIMGLSCALSSADDVQQISSPYSSLLSECCNMGKLPYLTSDFITEQLHFQYTQKKKHWWSKSHPRYFRCIETSGYTLYDKMIHREEGISLFEEMDYDVAKMFCSKNKKIIFFVIDPLCDTKVGHITKDGNYVYNGQREFIRHFISILEYNSKVLENVLSINVIITKNDRLSQGMGDAKKSYIGAFSGIERLCQSLKANRRNDYKPNVFNFSIGNVFWGDIFEYDDTDSEEIAKYIKKELDWL